MKPILSTS